MIDYKKQGKKNRASGKRFESKVREDLEKTWIIDRWTNNVEFQRGEIVKFTDDTNRKEKELLKTDKIYRYKYQDAKLVPCKPKYNPFTKSLMMNSPGFPDFICFRRKICQNI